MAGRDPQTPSGRTGGDLNTCLAKLEPLSCGQLGAGLGSGELAVCSASVGGSGTQPALSTPPAPSVPASAELPNPPVNRPGQPQ
ncbi:hypothetical protein [Haliangium sp. UPWRP_2]|uniref:hypothetical protein n=1 Tax=Haliangium sp. UPWRP_2 TaxID=1931276 RepID=UPI000B549415|nr:hypothetical protein [Haliangium sp. UPWRP_2]PSM31000.1 hypothetical protein BVG81_007645 [Haliangium sp. UPWRP_2]